ncbi:MAG: PKD domain-containing protein, partial [bacterium]
TKGEWYFTIKPYDGTDYGEEKRSDSVKISNTPPLAEELRITPLSPKRGDALTAEYRYTDADEDKESDSQIRWYKDNILLPEYNDKNTIPSATKGEWYFTIKPYDGTDYGEINNSSKAIIENIPPIVSNVSLSPVNPSELDDLVCSYVYNDIDEDPENGTEIKWYVDGDHQAIYDDQKYITSENTIAGQSWYFTIRPNDGFNYGDIQKSNTVIIHKSEPYVPPPISTIPEASSLKIKPDTPLTNDDLICEYRYIDLDGDEESGTEIRWYKDGELIEEYNNAKVIPSSATQKGQKWYFTIKPKDGKEFGKIKTSPEVIISNSPPVVANLSISPENPMTKDNLICSYSYYDIDEDEENKTEIRWFKDGELQPHFNNNRIITSDQTIKGQKWHFTVKPSDGESFGEIQISEQVIIVNTPPSVSDLVLYPENPLVTDKITCIYKFNDDDEDNESGTEIRWYKDGELQESFNDSKIIDKLEKGQRWYFTVKPKDGYDFGEIKTSETVIIEKLLPKVSKLKILPEFPLAKDNLLCSYDYIGTYLESGTEIRWYKDGEIQSKYNDLRIIPPSEVKKGQKWYFTVRPKDGEDFGKLEASEPVMIGNTPPSVSGLNILPKNPFTNDNLMCNYDYNDVDNDIENGTEIRWYKNGQLQSMFDEKKVIPSDQTSKFQEWYFTVRPKDGTDFGDIQISEKITIENSPPKVIKALLTPLLPSTTDELTCEYEYNDDDFDTITNFEIEWYKDGEHQKIFNNQLRIPSVATKKGQQWYFIIRVNDGQAFSQYKESNHVVIKNTPPVAKARVTTLKGEVLIGQPIELSGRESYDLDGDPLSYRWDFNGDDVIDSVEQNPTYIYSNAGKYIVTLIVNDGEVDSEPISLEIVVEENLVLLSAIYDIPNTILTLKFNKPIKTEIIDISGRVGVEINDSGKVDIKFQGKYEPDINQIESSEVFINIGHSDASAMELIKAGVIEHKKVDIIMESGLFIDIFGVKNRRVSFDDNINIKMMSGRFIMGIIGDANGNGTVTNYDAELIIQANVKGIQSIPIYDATLNVNKWLAKHEYSYDLLMEMIDVDRSGSISSYDASLVLQKAFGIIKDFSPTMSVNKHYRSEIHVESMEKSEISIEVDDINGVYSADILLGFPNNISKPVEVKKAYNVSEWLFAYALTKPGEIKISMAGISQPKINGPILNLFFDSIPIKNISDFKIIDLQINGGKIKTIFKNFPNSITLFQNYPNPFNPETWIPYQITEPSEVVITIYDLMGNKVRQLNLGKKMPGYYISKSKAAYWDGRNSDGEILSAGIYFYQLKTGNFTSVRKMTIIR